MSGSWCRIREYVEWSVIYLELEMSQGDVLQAIACRLMVMTEKASIHPHIHRNIHHHLIYPKVWIPMRHINCLWHWAPCDQWPHTVGQSISMSQITESPETSPCCLLHYSPIYRWSSCTVYREWNRHLTARDTNLFLSSIIANCQRWVWKANNKQKM